jgi:hypothetical protein
MEFVLLAAIFLTSSGFLVSTLPASAPPTATTPAQPERIAPAGASAFDEGRTMILRLSPGFSANGRPTSLMTSSSIFSYAGSGYSIGGNWPD